MGAIAGAVKGVAGAAKKIGDKAKKFGDKARENSFENKMAKRSFDRTNDTAAEGQADQMQNKTQGVKEKTSTNPYASPMKFMGAGMDPNAQMGGGFGTSQPSPDQTDMTSNASAMYRKKKGY